MRWQSNRRQFQVALTWAAAALLVWILWEARLALLLAFGSLLAAILLNALGSLIATAIRVPEKVGLALATLLVIAVVCATIWLFGSQLSSQFNGVMQQVEAGREHLKSLMAEDNVGQFGSTIADKATSFVTATATTLASLGLRFIEGAVVLVITAIYLAAQPRLYSRGIVAMFAPASRPVVRERIALVETTLRRWLFGQLILMLLVGVMTFVALLVIGVPNPLALALIAGLSEIVPYIGPFISAVPALLVALTLGWWPALWTAVAYLVVHLIEGYVAAPLLERHFISIPPALILIGIVAVDLIFGTAGILLAAPVTVVAYILIKANYVADPLELESPRDPA